MRDRNIVNIGGRVHFRNPSTGRVTPMAQFQRTLNRMAIAKELEQECSCAEIGRRLMTRSIDVPNSKASRMTVVDHQSARAIRSCLMPILNDRPKENWNFYIRRMAQAIEYITERRKIKHGSGEWRELSAFLWMIWNNWRDGKREETLAALGITQGAYLMRIERLQGEFDDPEWAAYLICCALAYGVKLRKEEDTAIALKPPLPQRGP